MAIGLLCATFSKSQIVCFICGALVCFILYWVLLQDHYSSLSRGVLDLRDVVFFASIAVIAIVASIFTLDKLTRK
jgi:ABC-2 type transport system permease protein